MEGSPSGLWRLLGKQVCFGTRGSESRPLRSLFDARKSEIVSLPYSLGGVA